MLMKLHLAQIYVLICIFLRTCWGYDNLGQIALQGEASQRPVYLIAHRVLDISAVSVALKDGANAFEMDVAPHNGILYAYHDDKDSGWLGRNIPRDTVEAMMETFASHRQAGSAVTFLWLDIKKPAEWPSRCGPGCSIADLQKMAQRILEPVGVRVLYGFSLPDTEMAEAEALSWSLSANEAISIGGRADAVWERFYWLDQVSPLSVQQRVMDYGMSILEAPFVMSCDWSNHRGIPYPTGVCYELKQGANLRDRSGRRKPRFGKVFGWTIRGENRGSGYVETLMGTAKVDGLIYGEATYDYRDHPDNRAAIQQVKDWVYDNSNTHRVAGLQDTPW